MLEDRDYTLIIDQSRSMSSRDQVNGKSRWQIMAEATLALASKCEDLDPDGLTIYTFSESFRRYDNVTADKVRRLFQENTPGGDTDLAAVLQDALDNYFRNKLSGSSKYHGETILVITDGETEERQGVVRVLIEASQRIDRDEELGISFIQVGTDQKATKFLKFLDDGLLEAGAKFDIVDTIAIDKLEDLTLTEVLLNAIVD